MFWKTFINKQTISGDGDDLLESIHYQLTTLLNSEAPMRAVPNAFPEVQNSLYCFGLDNSQSLSSQIDQDQFSRSLERMIKAFEPRLSDVSVFVQEGDSTKNAICFSIMAKVETKKGEHVFLFDSNLNLSNQLATMEGQEVV
ncbi:type VI secretion system baseplate subunit TssE [Vibrio fluminensis]|uniref:type VI secretion system baseplate subunit TssE n=1 Tax=Vibrio fluminensis TaxID=2783614 RepID=UPI001E2BE655|nr:type VI secretion system baseplate subunit TssE [Vibrio fluminensis]